MLWSEKNTFKLIEFCEAELTALRRKSKSKKVALANIRWERVEKLLGVRGAEAHRKAQSLVNYFKKKEMISARKGQY